MGQGALAYNYCLTFLTIMSFRIWRLVGMIHLRPDSSSSDQCYSCTFMESWVSSLILICTCEKTRGPERAVKLFVHFTTQKLTSTRKFCQASAWHTCNKYIIFKAGTKNVQDLWRHHACNPVPPAYMSKKQRALSAPSNFSLF